MPTVCIRHHHGCIRGHCHATNIIIVLRNIKIIEIIKITTTIKVIIIVINIIRMILISRKPCRMIDGGSDLELQKYSQNMPLVNSLLFV